MTVESTHAIILRLLRLLIGLKISRQVLDQLEAKPKPIAHSDWLIALFVSFVIDQSNYSGIGFSTAN